MKFKSKPISIQIDKDNNVVSLLQDGSIWVYVNTSNVWTCIAEVESTTEKKKTSVDNYTDQFESFWIKWVENIKNGSNKKLSFKAYSKLKEEEKTALFSSITYYASTNNEHQYLKRCETYINQKHWESLEVPVQAQIKEEVIDRSINLKGAF